MLPWNGSEPMFTETQLRRADGPFEQQIVLSMVAILAFFFIIYLRRLMGDDISAGRALLHRVGAVASLGAALLPLDRGLIFALVPIAMIDCFSKHRLISRRIWIVFFATILFATVAARLLDPQLYEDRILVRITSINARAASGNAKCGSRLSVLRSRIRPIPRCRLSESSIYGEMEGYRVD